MDFASKLRKRLSPFECIQVSDYLLNNRDKLKSFLVLYTADDYVVSQSCGRILEYCLRRDKHFLDRYTLNLIKSCQRPHSQNAERRNTMRLFQFMDIPFRYSGRVLDLALRFLADKDQPIAVRVFSMTVAYQNTLKLPDIQRELRLMIESEMAFATPAFRSRAMKILQRIPSL